MNPTVPQAPAPPRQVTFQFKPSDPQYTGILSTRNCVVVNPAIPDRRIYTISTRVTNLASGWAEVSTYTGPRGVQFATVQWDGDRPIVELNGQTFPNWYKDQYIVVPGQPFDIWDTMMINGQKFGWRTNREDMTRCLMHIGPRGAVTIGKLYWSNLRTIFLNVNESVVRDTQYFYLNELILAAALQWNLSDEPVDAEPSPSDHSGRQVLGDSRRGNTKY